MCIAQWCNSIIYGCGGRRLDYIPVRYTPHHLVQILIDSLISKISCIPLLNYKQLHPIEWIDRIESKRIKTHSVRFGSIKEILWSTCFVSIHSCRSKQPSLHGEDEKQTSIDSLIYYYFSNIFVLRLIERVYKFPLLSRYSITLPPRSILFQPWICSQGIDWLDSWGTRSRLRTSVSIRSVPFHRFISPLMYNKIGTNIHPHNTFTFYKSLVSPRLKISIDIYTDSICYIAA